VIIQNIRNIFGLEYISEITANRKQFALNLLIGSSFLSLNCRSLVILGQEIRELLIGGLGEHSFLPQVRSEVAIRLGDSGVGCLGKVAESASGSLGRGVAVVNASHLEQFLRYRSRDDTSSTWCRDQSHPDGTTLACHLTRHSVRLSDLVPPESSPDRYDRQFGHNDGTTDGSGNLFAAFHSKTDVSIVVSDGNKSLEPGPLSGTSLFLHGHDLQNLVLERGSDEQVNDLVLLDREREQVDFLQRLDPSILHQTS